MAQRTGAERFLASIAKVASAGLCLALAAAALLALAGCGGGGSSDGSTSGAAEPSSTNAEGSAGKQGAPATSKAAKSLGESSSGSSASGSEATKHGPKVAAPKGEQEPEISQKQREESTLASIALTSPDLSPPAGAPIKLPASYTCDGKDIWPRLQWQGIPAGTEELALEVMNVQPVNEAIFFDWAVAGIDPSLSGLGAGKLPKGAVMGKNSFGKNGYSICPPKGTGETFYFTLYAVPRALSPKQGFDPLDLREKALAQAGNAGLLAVAYSR